jgi:hypothetical protein
MPSNTSLLDTNLNTSPYFDDYDPSKQFHKVLFKPRTAVQTRELNQLQSILQQQISYFGKNIYKEGSVIDGCEFNFDRQYFYVKLNDTYANGTALTVSDLKGLSVYNGNGLKAEVVETVNGLLSADPNLNTIYLKYKNSGTYANGSVQKNFDKNESLVFCINSDANTYQGTVLSANVTYASGQGYSMHVNDGVVFKKGHFLYVANQSVIVEKYSNVPNEVSVGFDAIESIVGPNNDESLFDNAAGSPNYAAPGADRLKLTPKLIVRSSSTANTQSFFSLVDFKEGAPVTIRNDVQFNSVAKEVARRTYETNGNFVVSPFVVTSAPIANTLNEYYANNFNAVVGKGLGYVEGYRVEFLSDVATRVRKGTDYRTLSGQSVSLNFGYYVLVNEFSGSFGDSNSIIEVELHNVAKKSISDARQFLSVTVSSGTKIGKAYVRGCSFDNGIQGVSSAQYRLYLFDIEMNPGLNFNDVKSVVYKELDVMGVADIITVYNPTLDSNTASIYNPSINMMLFPFGQKAIKADGFGNTSFTYRKLSTANMLEDGTATVTIIGTPGGDEYFAYNGTLSINQMNDFLVVPSSDGFSDYKSGTVQTYTTNTAIRGTGTYFVTDYVVGDKIYTNGDTVRTIVSISNNIFLTADANGSVSSSGLSHQKAFIIGNPIPFSGNRNRSMTVSDTVLNIDIGETANAEFGLDITHSIRRTNTIPIKKDIVRDVYVKIDCSNNDNGHIGPWCIGLPDIYKLEAVYIDYSGQKSYSASGTDYKDNFTLDNGQRDTYYDLAYLSVKNNSITNKLTSSTTMLLKLSTFVIGTSQGKGFFTCNSYPIDDVNTSNNLAISTSKIPIYYSQIGKLYDLRDCVDFRPYVSNTAVVNTNISYATVNPSTSVTFNNAPFLPSPDTSFLTDVEYYIGRVDRLSIDINGNVIVTEGIPDASRPQAPLELNQTMSLSLMRIPPYPSLTTKEAKENNRYDIAVSTQPSQNKRYTMRDIAKFDKRITNLEYYTSLSMLESSAATLQVRSSSTGQTRFQNGIFVDSFNGFDLSNTKHPMFYIAIDPDKTQLRPAFVQVRSDFVFDEGISTNVTKHGELVMLNHTSNNVFIVQNFASKYHNVVEGNVYTWRGRITLTPSGSQAPDITAPVDVVNNLDLAQNWINLQQAWGTQWNNWSLGPTTYADTLISATADDGGKHVTNFDTDKIAKPVDTKLGNGVTDEKGIPLTNF